MGYFEFLHGSRLICLLLSNSLTICLQKTRKIRDSSPLSLLIRHNTLAPWRTTSTIQAYGDHHFLHLDTNPVICRALVHSVNKTHVLVVTVDLIWLLFLNIISFFNFVATPIKSLRFTRFIRSNANRPAVVLTHHCQSYTAFLLDVRCSKFPCSIFLQFFVPNDSAFALLSTPVSRMLWTPRWVGRRTDVR